MAHTPAQQERKLVVNGAIFIAIGLPLFTIGIAIALLLDGTALGIGVALAVLGALPVIVGAVLTVTASVQRRDRQGKPWA